MTQLTLTSSQSYFLRPVIESAIENEIRVFEVAIRKTQWRLHQFESQYGLSTPEFLEQYRIGDITETLEIDEWIGESRMLDHLQGKLDTLRSLEIAD